MSERDFKKNPYSKDEKRVAKFFFDLGIGGGPDPIGSLMATHQALAAELRQLKALVGTANEIIEKARKDLA